MTSSESLDSVSTYVVRKMVRSNSEIMRELHEDVTLTDGECKSNCSVGVLVDSDDEFGNFSDLSDKEDEVEEICVVGSRMPMATARKNTVTDGCFANRIFVQPKAMAMPKEDKPAVSVNARLSSSETDRLVQEEMELMEMELKKASDKKKNEVIKNLDVKTIEMMEKSDEQKKDLKKNTDDDIEMKKKSDEQKNEVKKNTDDDIEMKKKSYEQKNEVKKNTDENIGMKKKSDEQKNGLKKNINEYIEMKKKSDKQKHEVKKITDGEKPEINTKLDTQKTPKIKPAVHSTKTPKSTVIHVKPVEPTTEMKPPKMPLITENINTAGHTMSPTEDANCLLLQDKLRDSSHRKPRDHTVRPTVVSQRSRTPVLSSSVRKLRPITEAQGQQLYAKIANDKRVQYVGSSSGSSLERSNSGHASLPSSSILLPVSSGVINAQVSATQRKYIRNAYEIVDLGIQNDQRVRKIAVDQTRRIPVDHTPPTRSLYRNQHNRLPREALVPLQKHRKHDRLPREAPVACQENKKHDCLLREALAACQEHRKHDRLPREAPVACQEHRKHNPLHFIRKQAIRLGRFISKKMSCISCVN